MTILADYQVFRFRADMILSNPPSSSSWPVDVRQFADVVNLTQAFTGDGEAQSVRPAPEDPDGWQARQETDASGRSWIAKGATGVLCQGRTVAPLRCRKHFCVVYAAAGSLGTVLLGWRLLGLDNLQLQKGGDFRFALSRFATRRHGPRTKARKKRSWPTA